MFEGLLLEATIIIILVLANGYFAASEIAIVSARKGRLEQYAEEGRPGAEAALALAEDPNRFLSAVQIGITLIGTFAAAFGGARIAEGLEQFLEQYPIVARYATSLSLLSVVLVITYLSLILGELVPKRLALQNPERTASAVAPIMSLISRLGAPVVEGLTLSTEFVLRLLGRHNVPEEPVTEEDIMALVRRGTVEGTVEATEHELISSVFDLTDRTVRSLMTPRTQVTSIALSAPLPEVLQAAIESGFSRLPVYGDTPDQIVGVLHVKNLLRGYGKPETLELRALLRPPLYVLEQQPAAEALRRLQQHNSPIALVLDEYGQIAGLITIEDILEELVGELTDEYDEEEDVIVQRDDGSYLVDGLLPIADLADHLSLSDLEAFAREADFDTTAGLLLALLGRSAKVGDTVSWEGHIFEVVDMDGLRIDKLLISPGPLDAGEQTEGVLASGAVLPPPGPLQESDPPATVRPTRNTE
jgi:putative hemolysin